MGGGGEISFWFADCKMLRRNGNSCKILKDFLKMIFGTILIEYLTEFKIWCKGGPR